MLTLNLDRRTLSTIPGSQSVARAKLRLNGRYQRRNNNSELDATERRHTFRLECIPGVAKEGE